MNFPPCLCVSGVGGNLVAVQASRISTYLHMNGLPMGDPNPTPRKCPTPCTSFFGSCKLTGGHGTFHSFSRGFLHRFLHNSLSWEFDRGPPPDPDPVPVPEPDGVSVPGCVLKENSLCLYLTGLKWDPPSLPAVNSRSARVLFLLVAPGHLVFLYTINSLRGGHTTLTPIFITFYLVAALLQVHTHKIHFLFFTLLS